MNFSRPCLWLLLVSLSACAPDKIRKLEITGIAEIRLRSVTTKTLSMDVTLRIRNPYPATARAKNVSFQLSLGKAYFGKGYLVDPFEIPSHSTIPLTVPIVVDCEKVDPTDFDSLFAPRIGYVLQGSLDLEKPVRASQVEIDARGEVQAPERLEVVLVDRSVLSIVSLQDSSIQELLTLIRKGKVILEIRNPFSFLIPVRHFSYEVGLGSALLADGNTSDPMMLQPGMNRLSVTVKPQPLDAVEGMLRGMLDRRVPRLNLRATLDLAQNERNLSVRLRYPAE